MEVVFALTEKGPDQVWVCQKFQEICFSAFCETSPTDSIVNDKWFHSGYCLSSEPKM